MRAGRQTEEDRAIIEEWRAAHRPVINTFQALLRRRCKNLGITVAQRHKRLTTIIDKLNRFPDMQLVRMDDVAGCRLIFISVDELYAFRSSFHKAQFRHQLRNEVDKYDYIKSPKFSGYRGVHDVYTYDVNSKQGLHLKGLYIELQYRTLAQHAWATCVEIVGHITDNQPKFSRGPDPRYAEILRLASELIARHVEDLTSCLPDKSDDYVIAEFERLDKELGFLFMLRGIEAADAEISAEKNVILLMSKTRDDLRIEAFRDHTEAMRRLFDLERDMPEYDIVLVKADKSEYVRTAFRNYFRDATDFIDFIESARDHFIEFKKL